MIAKWSVETIYSSVNDEKKNTRLVQHFETQKSALSEYGKKFKAGLPANATSANLYLWQRDPRPQGRAHALVRHTHFWKDQSGTHCNDFPGAVQV